MFGKQFWNEIPLAFLATGSNTGRGSRGMLRTTWEKRCKDTRLPLWLRVVAYAEAHHDESGHAPLYPEQLRTAIDSGDRTIPAQEVSRAIRWAIRRGFLDPSSSARCLVLVDHKPTNTCPATHRTRQMKKVAGR